jgi:amino acid adenylation domain-containing protein
VIDYSHRVSKCIQELFEEQALLTPSAEAVVCGGRTLSYGELRARAIALSRTLISRGIEPEMVVGLMMDRSPELIVSMLATLYAGAGYLPVDPLFPAARIRFMLEDSRAKALCSDEVAYAAATQYSADVIRVTHGNTEPGEALRPPDIGAHPESLAYVMYTSGSTGMPKGVEVLHRGITRLVHGGYARFGSDEVFLHLSSPSFDASTFEVWGTLLHGGKCVVMPERLPGVSDIARVITEHGVTTMWLTASYFNTIIDEAPEALRGLRQLLIGGETLSTRHVRSALASLPETTIINGYGPTENTTFTCCYSIPRDLNPSVTSIPIGTAISGTTLYVLDDLGKPVPDGEEGELYTGGDGVARGYLGRPELTRSSFLHDPFVGRSGAMMYRTGDLVLRRPDGIMEFVGRVDDQAKISGYRIEPAEVQAVLTQYPPVRMAVVLTRIDPSGEKQLLAYLVLTEGEPFDEGEFQAFVETRLPEFMRPSFYVRLAAIPLNANGKVDRNALPLPWEVHSEMRDGEYSTEMERTIARVWAAVLGGRSFGSDRNFFEFGAKSLHAVRVHARLEEILGKQFPITALFQYPTIHTLALHLGGDERKPSEVVSEIRDRAQRQASAMAQMRMKMKRSR